MQVILLENVQNLGVLGDSVRVRPGYARNFLIPRGKAVAATPANLAEFEERRAGLERQQAEVLAAAQARADGFEGVTVTIAHKAGEGGKLFGSVGAAEIVDSLKRNNVSITQDQVRLTGPMKELGLYTVKIHVGRDIEGELKIWVVPSVTDEEPPADG